MFCGSGENGTQQRPDYISTNGLRFPRLPEVTLLLRHVIRCHSAVPAKVPAPPDGAAWTFSKKRAWRRLERGSPPLLRCSRNLPCVGLGLCASFDHLLGKNPTTSCLCVSAHCRLLSKLKISQLIAKGNAIFVM